MVPKIIVVVVVVVMKKMVDGGRQAGELEAMRRRSSDLRVVFMKSY